MALIASGTAQAQQLGDNVPESALRGPSYSLDNPPSVHGSARIGDGVFGAYVAALQRALPPHGYRCGPPTGRLDPATEQAILAYQADAGLPRDAHAIGVLKATLDHVTYARPPIFASRRPVPPLPADASAVPPEAPGQPMSLAPPPEPSAPDGPPVPPPPGAPDEATIRLVQQGLKAKGYDVDVNGQLDVYTENAIKVFQAANGLPRDGRIDQYLIDLLKK